MTATTSTARFLRSGLLIAFAGCALGGAVMTPSVQAATDQCAASQIAKTIGSVGTSMGTYLDAHPETNAATTIAQQPAGPQSMVALKAYFDANPQAGKDMQQLQSPLVALSTQCKLPVSLPQLLGLMQAAQPPAGALPSPSPTQSPSPVSAATSVSAATR